MAYEGTVNDQITDSVTQTMLHVVGHAPSHTKSMLDALMAETVGMAMYNAVTNQHNAQMVSNASVIAACARMLKTPTAITPIAPMLAPTILAVLPATIPVNESTAVELIGSSFLQDPTVLVLDKNSHVLATLAGSTQLSSVAPNTIKFTYTFPSGAVGLQVQNVDLAMSNVIDITVETMTPTFGDIRTLGPDGYKVLGSHFHPDLAVTVHDAEGKCVPKCIATEITPDSFLLTLPSGSGAGPFRLTVTNPDRPPVSKLFTATAVVVSVQTVCDSHKACPTVEEPASESAEPEGRNWGDPGSQQQ